MTDAPKLGYWGEVGFARAMAMNTGAEPSGEYPTQDKHTPEDEQEFITGFNLGHNIFKSHGYETAAAYLNEAKSHG